MDPIRIVFFAAAPSDLPRPRVEVEYRHIEAELARSAHRDRFDWRFMPGLRRGHLLRDMIRVKPHVVHFSGHGNENELIFENDRGEAEAVSAEDLQGLFSAMPVAERPRVVVLSACYSQRQAEAVIRVVDCAIGMSQDISDNAAFAFASGFYLAVGQGLSIDQAVKLGRIAMPGGGGQQQLPRLHLRESVSAEQLRLLNDGPVSRFPSDMHINRSELLDCFGQMLRTGQPRLLVVTAESAMGKSRLLRAMARDAESAHPLAFTDLTRSTATPEKVLDRIANALSIEEPAAAAPSSMSAEPQVARHAALMRSTRQLVAQADEFAGGRGTRAVILLDGFDQKAGDLATWLEDGLLPAILRADHVTCVLSGRVEPEIYAGLHLVRQDRLGNFSAADVREALAALRLDSSRQYGELVWLMAEEGNPYQTVSQLRRLWHNEVKAAQ